MPAKKRKPYIPPKRSAPGAPASDAPQRPAALSINTSALEGRKGLAVGDRVRILGTGLYAGEVAVIERIAGGVVPSAGVRTESGRARTVRTIDLEPVGARSAESPEAQSASSSARSSLTSSS